MKLKEVLNLRKLQEEFYDEFGLKCSECPFVSVCNGKDINGNCIVGRIFEDTAFSDDLYDMEEKGTLDSEYQMELAFEDKEQY